tara:strand:+ start:95 stop:1516 length:1422 start_codon:yes stop_codon:yes gene_type:complete
MSTDVKEPRIEYSLALPGVERNRAAIAGGRAVKAGGIKFLAPLASMCCYTTYDDSNIAIVTRTPTLTLDGQADYNKYLDNAYFEDVTGRTVQGLLGLIYSKQAKSEFPPEIEYLKENSDGKGTPLRELSKAGCAEAMASDWSGYLTARPSTPLGSSPKDVETNNLRPKLLHYKFESIINWNYEIVNNIEKLSLLVLKEAITTKVGFKVEVEDQYRVLEIIEGVYHQSVYDEDGSLVSESLPVIVNGNKSDEIPFFWVKAPLTGNAPIVGLADANFQQYKLYADYGGKLHHSSFVIYTETGAGPGTNMVMGNGVKWTNQNPEAKFGVLQPDGNSDGHRLALQDINEKMASQGAEQLRPRASGAESAEAKSLDKVAQNSTTSDIATTVSEAITKASDFASKWMGGNGGVVYSLNTDYNPTGINPQLLATVFAIYQAGNMPADDFFTFLQRGELINSAKTIEQYISETSLAGTGME